MIGPPQSIMNWTTQFSLLMDASPIREEAGEGCEAEDGEVPERERADALMGGPAPLLDEPADEAGDPERPADGVMVMVPPFRRLPGRGPLLQRRSASRVPSLDARAERLA